MFSLFLSSTSQTDKESSMYERVEACRQIVSLSLVLFLLDKRKKLNFRQMLQLSLSTNRKEWTRTYTIAMKPIVTSVIEKEGIFSPVSHIDEDSIIKESLLILMKKLICF